MQIHSSPFKQKNRFIRAYNNYYIRSNSVYTLHPALSFCFRLCCSASGSAVLPPALLFCVRLCSSRYCYICLIRHLQFLPISSCLRLSFINFNYSITPFVIFAVLILPPALILCLRFLSFCPQRNFFCKIDKKTLCLFTSKRIERMNRI